MKDAAPVVEPPAKGKKGGGKASKGDPNKPPAPNHKKKIATEVGITMAVSRIRRCIDTDGVNAQFNRVISILKAQKAAAEPAPPAAPAADGKEAEPAKPLDPPKLEPADLDLIQKGLKDLVAKINKKNAEMDQAGKPKNDPKPVPPEKVEDATFEQKIEAVSDMKYRLSNETASAMAILADYVIRQLLEAGITNAVKPVDGKPVRTVQVRHMLDGPQFQKLEVAPLVRNLPCVVNALDHMQDAETRKIELLEAELERAKEQQRAKNEAANGAAVAAKASASDDDDEKGDGTNFKKYVVDLAQATHESLKTLGEPFAGKLNFAGKLKELCSDIVVQLCETFASVLPLGVDKSGKSTVSTDDIVYVAQFTLTLARVDHKDLLKTCNEKIARVKELESKYRKETGEEKKKQQSKA